jgi:hypothetical protein
MAQEVTAQVTAPINALMDKLVLQYNSSDMYAQLCAPQSQEGADEFDKVAVDPSAEAARMVQRYLSDPEKLGKERDAVSLVMRRAIYSLEKSGSMMGTALTTNQTTGNLDMSQMAQADQKVQRMASIYNCSKAILNAIDAGVAQRRAEVDAQLNGTAGAAGTVPAAGGVNVNPNSAGNRRGVINNNANTRPATVRKNRILQNQNNVGPGTDTGTPDFLGR